MCSERQEHATPVAASDEAQAPKPASRVRLVLRWVGKLAMLVAVGFLLQQLRARMSELDPIELDGRAVGHLLVAGLACLGVFAAGIGNWWVLLGRGDRDSLQRLAIVFAYSQVAKYLPGGVLQYAFGVAVGDRLKIPKTDMGVVLARDTVFSISIAGTLGVLGLLLGDQRATIAPLLSGGTGRLALIAGVALAIFAVLGLIAAKKPALRRVIAAGFRVPTPNAAASLVVFTGAQFLCYGLCASQIAAVFSPDRIDQLPSLAAMSAGFALAWVVGLLALGAPGGLGVREAILYALFEPALGKPLALATFVGMRVVLVVAELGFFAPAPFLLRRLEARGVPAAPGATTSSLPR